MGPDTWGPHGWKFLHFVSLGYPEKPTEKDKKKYKTFFNLIKTVLPCSMCAAHYAKNLKENPLNDDILNNKEKLMLWTVKMHNLVNISNNKKVYSDDEAMKLILNEKKCEEIKENNNYLIIIIIILVIILLLYFIKKN